MRRLSIPEAVRRFCAVLPFALAAAALAQTGGLSGSAGKVGDQPRIRPFGEFTWQDGLIDVIQKINGIAGIESIAVSCQGGRLMDVPIPVDLTKVGDIVFVSFRGCQPGSDKEPISRFPVESYLAKDGATRTYVCRRIEVVAEPIVIAGIPFKMSIRFAPALGLAVACPTKVLSAPPYDFPMIIERVEIISDSPGLKDHLQDINDIVTAKYGALKRGPNGCPIVEREDDLGSSVLVVACPGRYTITYTGTYEAERLEELYRKHIADIESQRIRKAPDMGAGL